MKALNDIIEASLRVQKLRDELRRAEEALAALIGKTEGSNRPVTRQAARSRGVRGQQPKSVELERMIAAEPSREFTARDLADQLRTSEGSTRTLLRRLVATGKAVKTPKGKFRAGPNPVADPDAGEG